MIEPKDWYKIKNIEQIDTPALVIYPQRVKENIQILKGMIGDYTRLRPHIKTHKTKEATLLMMAAGINKFKCATIAEAEMLGMSKADDVLLAYQPFGAQTKTFRNNNKRISRYYIFLFNRQFQYRRIHFENRFKE